MRNRRKPNLLLETIRPVVFCFCVIAILCCSSFLSAGANGNHKRSLSDLSWNTDAPGPERFVSVHGRRAAIFGYSEDGLEVWAYPCQLLSSYKLSFRAQGASSDISGQIVLRRVIYRPESVTRIYVGQDFIVRETLFVPLDVAGVIISYVVEGTRPVDIVVHFTPVLNLMWPAAIGGQEAIWNPTVSAYLLFEPTNRYFARIGSPDIVAHDDTFNDARHPGGDSGLSFTIRGGSSNSPARVFMAAGGSGEVTRNVATALSENSASLESAAQEHYSNLLSSALEIETPDPDVNRALAWSQVALDQSWVCNADLGCGVVAGYGPSRKARRPQYDWFFAGDGMITASGFISEGQYERAREELEFIFKYQDQKTGMVWHELSQSAASLEWGKYPYMFRHVDLTFDFLTTLGEYLSATGDLDFVKTHWGSIESAYKYCESLVDSKDGLPRIPSDKEGVREQDPLSDELTLSASWVAASEAFATLASETGHKEAVEQARTASQRAHDAIGARYWNEQSNFWITGYSRSGTPVIDRTLGPVSVIRDALFSESRINQFLDQLASSDFETDWGTRGKPASARGYDPNSYSGGSVWAIGTASTATAFWSAHRPVTAAAIWRTLVPWGSLDSLGHMHEALAGDYYHEERESVPEQTWSSSTFLTSAVEGLLGWKVDAITNRATFAPHIPADWNSLSVHNLRVGKSVIAIDLTISARELRLQFQNDGPPVEFVVDPEIPLGAELQEARLGNRPVPVTLERHSQDAHAKVSFRLEHGGSVLSIRYIGGVLLAADPPRLMVGEESRAIKITETSLRDRAFTISFDYMPSETSSVMIRTPWVIEDIQGATAKQVSPEVYRITLVPGQRDKESGEFHHGNIVITFAGR